MKLKYKLAILSISVLLSIIGFNLIASSYANEMIQVGNRVGYEMIANVVNK